MRDECREARIRASALQPGPGGRFQAERPRFREKRPRVDFAYRKATVTLPLFRGLSPSGKAAFFIITDASDFEVARRMGVAYAPKLSKAASSPGVQDVTIEDGVIHFKGNVDFAPVYKVVAGDPPTYADSDEAGHAFQ
jgi:hypothetical protein